MNQNLTIIRDVSGEDKNTYYLIIKDEKKIYKIEDEKELKIIKLIGEDLRWFEKERISNLIEKGYKLISEL